MARKNSCWSFNAGARGRNWVRAYEKGPGGIIFLEWREPVFDEEGHPVRDPGTGSPLERRRRTSTGHRDRTKAKRQAQELADRFGEMVATPAVLTLRSLIHLYVKELTPTKGHHKQAHDRRASSLFLSFFDARPTRSGGPTVRPNHWTGGTGRSSSLSGAGAGSRGWVRCGTG